MIPCKKGAPTTRAAAQSVPSAPSKPDQSSSRETPADFLARSSWTSDLDATQPILQVKDISKRFKKKEVLKSISFDVYPRDIFGIIGMSGSGKTTLFRMLIGFDHPDEGDIQVQQAVLAKRHKKSVSPAVGKMSVFKYPMQVQTRFGFAAQLPSFYDHLTVEENIDFYAQLYGMPTRIREENKQRLLELTCLGAERDTLASHLSGGMQRRLDIACALVHNPRILLLDEPTSDLDPIIRRQIWSMIRKINEQGTTIIVSSHILEEVEQLCTKIAILHDRKVMGYGTLDELKSLFARKQEVHIRSRPGNFQNILLHLKKEKVTIQSSMEKDGALVLFTPKEEDVLPKVAAAIAKAKEHVTSLDVNETTLSEIFEMLTQKKPSEEGGAS
ncbi:ABC transporter ATP-binding protein [Candidatus Woesearchaeota archaeon]|nr:ABC transporter ATP-binding protein [Candidatus Woesearchaeota archaeon]